MTQPVLRLLIQEKLDAGRLPYNSLPPYSGGPGHGETCDACEETVTVEQHVIGNLDAAGAGVQLHVACFHLWNVARQLPRSHKPPGDGPVGSASWMQARP